MAGKIPIILVTGFLGSGKTTLLQRLAGDHPDWRMIFLVNEFADTSIDELKLNTTGTPTQSVVGGSLFCECKAGEFVRVMKEQVLQQHEQQELDAVVIETSGIADPQAIGELMQMHGLNEHFEVRRIICVAAAKRFLTLMDNLPAVVAQVKTSDLIILNKIDLAKVVDLPEVEAGVRKLNPQADIIRAEHCMVDFDLLGDVRTLPNHPLFTCDANPFSTEELVWPSERSIEEARDWLENLPDTILRIKGTFTTPENSWFVERTVDDFSLEPSESAGEGKLVLIAHDDDQPDLIAARDSLAPVDLR